MSTEEIQVNDQNKVENELIETIGRCQEVLKELDTSKAWQYILEDCDEAITCVDSIWQDTFDEDKLFQARVSKLAYKHITEMRNRYEFDLESAQRQLDTMRNPDTQTFKDWD